MKDICTAARLSPGSVYTWFPSKKSIVDEMMRRRLSRFEAAAGQAETDPDAAIDAYVATVRQAADTPAIGWMNIHLVAESVRDPYVRDVMHRVVTGGIEVLEGALSRLEPARADEAAARARLLQAALFGIVIQRLIAPDDAAEFDLADLLFRQPIAGTTDH